MPNIDEVPQSTAEIKLLPVSENGRPPYWNFISAFVINVWIDIGMPFYICLNDRRRSYDLISIFKDGGHKVGNVLPGSGLAMLSV